MAVLKKTGSVKTYDPEAYNFGNFADQMNKNFSIDRAQVKAPVGTVGVTSDGVGNALSVGKAATSPGVGGVWGGATNSQTLGNSAQGGVNLGGAPTFKGVLSSFKNVLNGANNGEAVAYNGAGEGGALSTSPAITSNTSAVALPAHKRVQLPGGETGGAPAEAEGGNVNAESGDVVTDNGTIGTEGAEIGTEGAETGTGGGLLTPEQMKSLEGLYPASNVNVFEAPMDSASWVAAYSIDPEAEYKSAQAQLDYEFKTWMSGYGARAEQLYQMGLSNSGVSDIYGANAYTAYVQGSMDLKRAQIEAERQNKQLYQQYVDQYEADKAAKTEATNAKIATAFNAYAGSYTPEQEASVRAALAAQGLDSTTVESIIGQLNTYYYSLPEGSRPDVLANDANVAAAVNWLNTNYVYGMTDEELAGMLGATYSEDVVKAALAKFAPYKSTFDRLASDEAAKSAFSTMLELMQAGDTDLESLKQKAKGLGHSEAAIATAAENILPFLTEAQNAAGDTATLVNDAAMRIATTIFTNAETGESTYTGSESQKNYIRQIMQLAEYKDLAPYVEEIITKMDANLKQTKSAAVSDIVSDYEKTATDGSWLNNPATSTMANYIGGIEQSKQQYGINSAEYKDALAAGSASIKDYILTATDDEAMLEQAGAWLGVDFAEMDVADRISAVLEGAGELHRDGYMTDEDYVEIIDGWVSNEIALVNKDKTAFFGLSQIVGALEAYLDEKYMSQSMYDQILGNLANSVTLENGTLVGNTTSTIETPNGDTVPLNANVFIKVKANGSAKASSWSVSAISVYSMYNDDNDAEAFENKIKRMYGNVDPATPIYYNDTVYFWSNTGHLYKANMDESFFERDGKKETEDQSEWSKQLITTVISKNGPKPINTLG